MRRLHLSATTLLHATPIELIDAAVHAGYDGVGLRLHASPNLPYHPVVGNASLIGEMQARLAGSGMEVTEILAFYLQPDSDPDAFLPALETAAQFKARFALVQGDDENWPRLADNFARFCAASSRFGITPALEFVPSRPLSTLQMALRLIKESGADNAVLCLDPLHLIRSGGKPTNLTGLDTRLFPYAQFSDGVLGPGEPDLTQLGRMPLGQRRLPGEGTLPLQDILSALPPGIPLSVEVLQPREGPHSVLDARAWAKMTLDSTRAFLGQ